jgi:hypothetical protein
LKWKVSSLGGKAVNWWRLALSEADDLAVGRGDDDLALGDGREGRHGRGLRIPRTSCRWRDRAPVDAAVIGADQSTRARVVNVQSGLPRPDYRARRAALNRVTADVADRV